MMVSETVYTEDTALLLRFFLASEGMTNKEVCERSTLPSSKVTSILNGAPGAQAWAPVLMQEVNFDSEGLSVTEARSLETACANWSAAHGEHLQVLLVKAGVELKAKQCSNARAIPVPTNSLNRWMLGTARPRTISLMRVIKHFGWAPSFFDIVPTEIQAPASPNRLSDELNHIREKMGLSFTIFAKALGFTPHALQSWISGRTFPQAGSEDERRIELLCDLDLNDVRDEEELKREDIFNASPLGVFIQEKRRSYGLTRSALAARSNVSISQITAMERTTADELKPLFESLRKISDALDVSYAEMAEKAFGPQPASSFAERLRSLRMSRLITVREIAASLGVHPYSYRRFEMTQSTQSRELYFLPEMMGRVAAHLRVLPEDLLNPNKSAFSAWLKSRMDEQVVTLEVIAAETGVSLNDARAWVTGKHWPSLKQVEKLSTLCGADAHYARSLITG